MSVVGGVNVPPLASDETLPLQLIKDVLFHHPVYNACC